MLSIGKRVEQAKKESPDERYARVEIDLGAVENVGKNVKIQISGDYLAKIKYNGSATGCYFKFGNKRSSIIYASEFRKRHTPFIEFNCIYLTNETAQPGKVFTLFVGGAFAGEIEPSTGIKTGLTDSDGVDINPVVDKRYIAHSGSHLRAELAVADTAEKLIASSLNVKWAIISVEGFSCRWAFTSTVHRTGEIGIPVTTGSSIVVEYCDLSEIYFINNVAGAGQLPILNVEYAKEA